MGKHISDDTARKVRDRYADLKEWDAMAPEAERLSPKELDAKVSGEFDISRSAVADLVMGLTHTEAGGTLDVARRTRRDLYARERLTLGDTEARRRLQLRARNIDPAPKVERLVQRVTVMDSKGKPTVASVDLQPGESLHVALVTIGGEGA